MSDQMRLGVFAAIFDEEKRLLMLRRQDMDRWCLPGGFVEIGESFPQALIRECREEIGVEVAIGRLIGLYSEPARHLFVVEGNVRIHYFTAVFVATIVSGTPYPDSEESRGMGFFPDVALPNVVRSHRIWIEDAFRGQDFQRLD